MFERIKFDTYEPPVSLTMQAMENAIAEPEHMNTLGKLSGQYAKLLMTTFAPQMQGLAFTINGKIDVFHVPPISQYAKDHLYSLREFSVFHLKQFSYTSRTYYPRYILMYTYSGYGSLEYNGRTYHLGEGDGFFIDARKPHTYRCESKEWTHAVAEIQGPQLVELFQRFIENGSPLFTQPINGTVQQGFEELLRIYSTGQPYRDWQVSACIDAILTKLLVQSLKDSARSVTIPKNMQYLIQYIESNYRTPLTLERLSKFFGISPAHLTREFKKYTGYFIQLRLAYAKRLLGSATLPISTIAYESGFNDVNNFTNLFKKYTGMTPGAYRKQILHQAQA